MAHYQKRPKVKRYRRSFYSRKTQVKRVIGIIVLVAVVLGVAWLAAPHVIDWATHTWYTVVRNRDLSASSDSTASSAATSAAASEAASSAASSEPAASSAAEPKPQTPGTAIIAGSWAEADVTALTSDEAIRTVAGQLAAQGAKYAVITMKDSAGTVYYPSQTAAGAANAAASTVDPARIAAIFKEEGLIPVAELAAFRDPAGARAVRTMAIGYTNQAYLWLDNKASAGGNPWLNPYSQEAVQYIGDLIDELHTAGFDHVVLENVQFPSAKNSKQDFGQTNGVDRAGQLTADIAAWQTRFGDSVTLWYAYSLGQVTDTSTTLGAPAAQLGMKNLLVQVPSKSTMDEAARAELLQTLADAGIEHTVIRDTAANYYE